jgi:hypothetical protein
VAVTVQPTTNNTLSGPRNIAAILITLSGTGLIALLWFRELTGAALIDALLGTVYLYIGIGLLGQSRFTLFVAMVVPAGALGMVLRETPLEQLNSLQLARVSIDAAVIVIATIVLWRVRNHPSM